MPWWPADRWARMLAGDDCPMCADGHLPTNAHGELIASLPGSHARLSYNQTQAGYVALIAPRHAPELHDMTGEELRLFWADVAAVGRAVTDLLHPVKLDYLVMGHLCPHVHCHLIPRYQDDDPHGEVNPQLGDVRLSPAEFAARLEALRTALA